MTTSEVMEYYRSIKSPQFDYLKSVRFTSNYEAGIMFETELTFDCPLSDDEARFYFRDGRERGLCVSVTWVS